MSNHAGRESRSHGTHGHRLAQATDLAPGKRTLVEQADVQQRAETGGQPPSNAVHAAAARGTATPASLLPHADTIQRAFGRHDISSIQAHVGGEAEAATRDMGAAAYAIGDHVVLGKTTDLFTVAHEAAHVVQQRGGIQLKAGIGEAGDDHERHADAVADAVTQGRSAEPLLDRYGSGGAATGVQAKPARLINAMPDHVKPGISLFSSVWHQIRDRVVEYTLVDAQNFGERRLRITAMRELVKTAKLEIVGVSKKQPPAPEQERKLAIERDEFILQLSILLEEEAEEMNRMGLPGVAPDPNPRSTVGLTGRITETAEFYSAMALSQMEDESTRNRLREPPIDSGTAVAILDRTHGVWAQIRIDRGNGSNDPTGFVDKTRVAEVPSTLAFKDVKSTPLYDAKTKDPRADDVRQGGLGDCHLMAAMIATVSGSPEKIREMLIDHGDRVSVRFFKFSSVSTVPTVQWVTIEKSVPSKPVVVTPTFGKPYTRQDPVYASVATVIWPAMIEKAYAIFRGGGEYGGIVADNPQPALEALLGVRGKSMSPYYSPGSDASDPVDLEKARNPFTMSATKLVETYRINMTQAKALLEGVFSANAGLRGDRAAALERAREAIKGNPTALERLETDINANLEGALGSGLYSNRATQIYDKIAGALADGKKVSMGTREWKTDGGATGPSGEDLDTVPGLAGAHAYAVVGVSHPERPLEGATRLTVKVRNPWGAGPGGLGRGYTTERGSGRMVGQAVPNAAESDLDLTDFMSYCQTIAIV